jgi:hypothetical protein
MQASRFTVLVRNQQNGARPRMHRRAFSLEVRVEGARPSGQLGGRFVYRAERKKGGRPGGGATANNGRRGCWGAKKLQPDYDNT